MHLRSLQEAAPVLQRLRKSSTTVGSIHTLGALHRGHAEVIRRSAEVNDETVVTIYPNPAQFAPGMDYRYDLEADADLAFQSGATHVVSSAGTTLYPPEYVTFLDQGSLHSHMDGTIVPFMFRGMITMCIRWINFVQPDRTYWGMKDIGQTLLVKRAVKDLLIHVDVEPVPCVRTNLGYPVSSRLMQLPAGALEEVALLHRAQEAGRVAAQHNPNRDFIRRTMFAVLNPHELQYFQVGYLDIFDPKTFEAKADATPPFVIHGVLVNEQLRTFDGLYIESEKELWDGVPTIWINDSEARLTVTTK